MNDTKRLSRIRAGSGLLCLLGLLATGTASAQIVIDPNSGPAVVVEQPSSYDPGTPTPLLMVLHGSGGTGAGVTDYLQLLSLIDEYEFLYMAPNAPDGSGFWNVTAFGDAGYLLDLIEETEAVLNVDPLRVWIVGFSNGGSMAYRMACSHANRVAAILSLSGGLSTSPGVCSPSEPVHILQVHGNADPLYPEGENSYLGWIDLNGCDSTPETIPTVWNLDGCNPPAPDTTILRNEQGCAIGGSTEMWVIEGGQHGPCFPSEWPPFVMDYFVAHTKPEFPFIRGDANSDGVLALDDAIACLGHMFGDDPAVCPSAMDYDDDDIAGLSDVILLLLHLYQGGPPPGPPFPDCALDPSPGIELSCVGFICP